MPEGPREGGDARGTQRGWRCQGDLERMKVPGRPGEDGDTRGTWRGWRNGQRNLTEFNNEKVKVTSLGSNNPIEQ